MDLSEHSDAAPGRKLRLLFIHHSTGGQLLAEPGETRGELSERCIHEAHPNGGGLRRLLEGAGYEVHEASYGSQVGERTDLFDWLPLFRDRMSMVLRVDLQDTLYQGDVRNDVVLFKSCFPNSDFVGEGEAPGNPQGPELTVWNAKATLGGLLEHFAAHPNVLFVYFTAPPLAPPQPERLWKWLAKQALGRAGSAERQYEAGALARRFNNWVKAPSGWLRSYPHKNVVVFDYYDALTDHGESNMLRYPTEGGWDSHPSSDGQRRAAAELVPLLNRAVRRAGLDRPEGAQESVEAPSPAQPAPQ